MPKDFKFVGWHPNCRCYPTFILMTDEELKARRKALLNGEEPPKIKSKNEITDVPVMLQRGQMVFYDAQSGSFLKMEEYNDKGVDYIGVLKVDKLLLKIDLFTAIVQTM